MDADERLRHMQEAPWLEMSVGEIQDFLHFNPTYFMGPKEASDWWGAVNDMIKRDKEKPYRTPGNSIQYGELSPCGRVMYERPTKDSR